MTKYIVFLILILGLWELVKRVAPPLYPSDNDIKDEAFYKGQRANRDGLKLEDCPYRFSLLKNIWIEGWKTESERLQSN